MNIWLNEGWLSTPSQFNPCILSSAVWEFYNCGDRWSDSAGSMLNDTWGGGRPPSLRPHRRYKLSLIRDGRGIKSYETPLHTYGRGTATRRQTIPMADCMIESSTCPTHHADQRKTLWLYHRNALTLHSGSFLPFVSRLVYIRATSHISGTNEDRNLIFLF